jgi:hypothetical protein
VAHNVVEQFSPIAVLHYHVQFLLGLDDFIELDDVGVAHLFQDFYFPGDALDVFLVVDLVLLQDLDGDLLSGEGVLA